MTSIAIAGAGISGLHLGLFLQQHDVPVTIYTDRDGDQIAAGRLLNTVGHHHHTLERERVLGVHHWDEGEHGYMVHHHTVVGMGEEPIYFRGDFAYPSLVIDYRLYLPQLMRDFQDRGGDIVLGPIDPAAVERLGEEHDLVVVAAGRGFSGMFAPVPEHSPYDRPQRRLAAGIYHGVRYPEPWGVSLHISLGHGELVELPILSRDGHATALLFENIPGGDLEVLADARYDEDPDAFNRLVREKLERHYPACAERVEAAEFGLMGPGDLLQGGLTPVVREDYTRLSSGTYAIAMGDAHCVVDPVNGQGANSASYSASVIGRAIVEDLAFDERLCERIARERRDFVLGVSNWTNLTLNPQPHFVQLLGAMAQSKDVCDAFTRNFNHPDRQWDALATPERTAAFIARHGRRDLSAAAPV
jgi:2-polyprenyl-6-methoxyphenol hydroxylase-like FAD-dependent oxidoreductase